MDITVYITQHDDADGFNPSNWRGKESQRLQAGSPLHRAALTGIKLIYAETSHQNLSSALKSSAKKFRHAKKTCEETGIIQKRRTFMPYAM